MAVKEKALVDILKELSIAELDSEACEAIHVSVHGNVENFSDFVKQGFKFHLLTGVSKEASDNIHKWFSLPTNKTIWDNTVNGRDPEVVFVAKPKEPETTTTYTTGSSISGKTICITGSTPGYKNRDQYGAKLRDYGATYTSTLSKNVDLLIIANNPGRAKPDSAAKLGIPTISLADFVSATGIR